MITYPRLKALGPLCKGQPYDVIGNPIVFNLNYPGHPKHLSTVSLATFKTIKDQKSVSQAERGMLLNAILQLQGVR